MSDETRRPARPPKTYRSSRPRLRNQFFFAAGIIVLAVGAFYTALVVATQIDHIFFPDSEIRLGGLAGMLPGVDNGGSSDIGHGRINVLVLGIDKRYYEGDSSASRTDTMFVMTIDPASHTARGLGIPRDLYVDIPTKSGNSTYKERINAAYVIGETQNYPGGGIGLTKTVVQNLLNLKINYYIMIDFEGFRKVIDLLGGVDVDVSKETAVNDPYYSETEKLGDYYPCVFGPGIHHMDGSDALCFSRTRYNGSDFDRILRQQRVIFAVMDKAASLDVLTNAVSLWKSYKNTVKTDISDLQIPGFAKLAGGIDQNTLSFMTLAAVTSPYKTPEGADVLIPSPAGIKQLRDAFLSDSRLLSEAATIELQNGSGTEGQATKALEYLASLGIPKPLMVAINAAADQPKTEIIDYSDKEYTATWLADALGVDHKQVRKAQAADASLRSSQSDIVVLLGSDAKLESALAR